MSFLNIYRQGVSNMSLAIKKRSWQHSSQEEWQMAFKLLGIKLCKSRFPRKCQLCWKHQSKYRRLCPICDKLIAPGCWPVKCWMDELNHCKDCHTLIEIMKNMRYKKQFMPNNPGINIKGTQSTIISYSDFPVGVQINIMMFVLQPKDFARTKGRVMKWSVR